MIKLVYCLTRKEPMSRAEFQDYWRGPHADKVKKFADAIGMKRYVQSHSYDTPMNGAVASARGGLDGYDGLMEGWWDSEEQAMAALTSSQGAQAMDELLKDEGHFIDPARSPLFFTREHSIF